MKNTNYDFQNHIRQILNRHSIDEIASCAIDSLEHEETIKKIYHIFPAARSVIVILKKIPNNTIKTAPNATYQEAASQTFKELNTACQKIVLCLEKCGVNAVWPGEQKTPHQKHIAVKAGLGFIGDSKLLISSRCGIDVHLESILADKEIEFAKDIEIRFRCNSCGLCIAACPVNAISATGVNEKLCMYHRSTILRDINGKNYCGLCMKSCPQKETG